MASVGMLRTAKQPRVLARTVAYICNYYNIKFFYFNPEDVNLNNNTINGLFFENGEWVKKTTSFPNVIDNEPVKASTRELYKTLQKYCLFTTQPIGAKKTVFDMLAKSGGFEDVLIPYKIVSSADEVFELMEKYPKILLKPSSGNQGRNIYVIQKNHKGYNFITNENNVLTDKEELTLIINDIVMNKKYLYQPFIESKTVEGSPYDVRIHLRKDTTGKWKTVKIYPRIGLGKNITANVSQGGGVSPINPFLENQFGERWKNVKRKLNNIAKTFPAKFESFYDYELDSLGIDLGIDSSGKPWLFEVNTYPGQHFFCSESSEVRVEYYRYLLKKVSYTEKPIIAEKTVAINKTKNQELMIGMLTSTRRSSQLKICCAAAAKLYNVNFCYFSYEDINFETKEVVAYTHIDGKWVKRVLSYEKDIHVIYDRLKAHAVKKYKPYYEQLSHLIFNEKATGYSANKNRIYNHLKSTRYGEKYLIDYKNVTQANEVLEFISQYNDVILKPSAGLMGKGIIKISKQDNEFVLQQDDEVTTIKAIEFEDKLNLIMENKRWIIQQFIFSRTKDNQPFDIRVHIVKGKDKKWNFANIYPRIGVNPVRINGTGDGGYIGAILGFLKRNYSEAQAKTIYKELKTSSLECAKQLEILYKQDLFEIGLDIAIDKEGEIHFIEANLNRPGVIYYEFVLAKHAIAYCIDLFYENAKKEADLLLEQ